MPDQRSTQHNKDMSDLDPETQAPESVLEEGKVFDYITGKQVKESDKERVRQRIARALIHEYGIAAEDMEPDFKVKLLGKSRKIDIAIFKPGQPHTEDNLYRAVVVEKEPKLGTKGAYRMRDPEEARKEFELLETVMAEVDSCDYGLWTNGLEFFFFKKEVTRFDTRFKPIGDWPLGDAPSASKVAPWGVCAVLSRKCCASPSGAATTTSTATRACPRMLRSGSSFISSSARCMTNSSPTKRASFGLVRSSLSILQAVKNSQAHQAAVRGGQEEVPRPVQGQRRNHPL